MRGIGLVSLVVALVAALGLGTAALAAKKSTKTKTVTGASSPLFYDNLETLTPLPVADFRGKGKIKDVNVGLRLANEGQAELDITLLPPNGPDMTLSGSEGGIGDGFGTGSSSCSGNLVVFDDQAGASLEDVGANELIDGGYRPEEALSALKRKSPTGTWRLLVEDLSGPGDGGNVSCFEVTVKYKKAKKKRK
jgi:subtilisin-like proprotein convertase family protein